ncbi:MAG: hypothetical protein IIA23_01155 [Chloroflexi bacterium]|nr:hypothetical protein [Chloroflexota bacterium]
MPRTALLLAGLGAALIVGGLTAVRSEAIPSTSETPWVEQHAQNVTPGQVYRLDGCLTVTAPGLTFVSLRIVWYDQQEGFGDTVKIDQLPGDPWRVGSEQCLSLTNAEAPCAARSARYGVVVKGDTGALDVSSLDFSLEPGATPTACPTPTATPTPTPTPTPAPQAAGPPKPSPTPISSSPEPSLETIAEPTLFPTLVNGGFEDVREDGTPYGWRKIGGEISASGAVSSEGDLSASLLSRTESTKWLYQAVSVEGGSYYQLRAMALKNDPAAREVLLRVSWYASADGSGSQLSTVDSSALTEDSPEFVALDTGPVRAPPEARSAKVRLLLRPRSATPVVVYFDDVRFEVTAAPPAEDDPDGGQQIRSATEDGGGTTTGNAPQVANAEVLGVWTGPATLANVRQERQQPDTPIDDGGRPLWPLLLAFGVPAAGLTVMAGGAWRRARLAERNERHL